MADPTIIIERDGGNYTVRVEPLGEGDHFAATYPTHKAAAQAARLVGQRSNRGGRTWVSLS